jgi:hypothetical protein
MGILILSGCQKEDTPPVSGNVTIDNTLYGNGPYYVFGFSFVLAEKRSTLDNPPPDITIDNDDVPGNLMFEANNRNNSFFLVGEYLPAEALQTFNGLTTITIQEHQWQGIGHLVKPDQVWIYRSGTGHYTKIRIVSTKTESQSPRDYAECTFDWMFQPDGSLTFPSVK